MDSSGLWLAGRINVYEMRFSRGEINDYYSIYTMTTSQYLYITTIYSYWRTSPLLNKLYNTQLQYFRAKFFYKSIAKLRTDRPQLAAVVVHSLSKHRSDCHPPTSWGRCHIHSHRRQTPPTHTINVGQTLPIDSRNVHGPISLNSLDTVPLIQISGHWSLSNNGGIMPTCHVIHSRKGPRTKWKGTVVVVVCIRSHNWSARQRHHRLQSVV